MGGWGFYLHTGSDSPAEHSNHPTKLFLDKTLHGAGPPGPKTASWLFPSWRRSINESSQLGILDFRPSRVPHEPESTKCALRASRTVRAADESPKSPPPSRFGSASRYAPPRQRQPRRPAKPGRPRTWGRPCGRRSYGSSSRRTAPPPPGCPCSRPDTART